MSGTPPLQLICVLPGGVHQGLPTCRGLWPVSLVAGSWGDIGPEGQNKAVTLPSPPLLSWCQKVLVGATQVSGVDATSFQQGPGHLLWGACSLSRTQCLVKATLPRVGYRGAGVQGSRAGLCPASFPPEFYGSLSMPLFPNGSQMVS